LAASMLIDKSFRMFDDLEFGSWSFICQAMSSYLTKRQWNDLFVFESSCHLLQPV